MTALANLRVIVLTSVLAAVPLSAGLGQEVTLRNGNFFVSYVDIAYRGGFEPRISRAYNSKSAFKGIFGWGWGCEYESYLTIMGDGSVVVHEYGGGAQNVFSPATPGAGELELAVERITQAAQAAGALRNSEEINQYQGRLLSDAMFRNEEWTKQVNAGRLQPRELPEGARLSSTRFKYQYLLRTSAGYTRTTEEGRTESFGLDGRLTRIEDRNGNWIRFEYAPTPERRWTSLQDNLGRAIRFSWTREGRVASLLRDDGKQATYQYNTEGELVQSRDVDGNSYSFSYAPDRRHNLTRIGYSDRTSTVIAYHPMSLNENVKSLKHRDGRITTYTYEVDPGDPGHLTIGIVEKKADGGESRNATEYFLRSRATGEQWTSRVVTLVDGQRTETEYSERCGDALAIISGADSTRFEYDPRCHVTRKETSIRIDSLWYDAALGKVTRVTQTPKPPGPATTFQFSYNDQGNLLTAESSAGIRFELRYDEFGRWATIADSEDEISFKYNSESRPSEIRHARLGVISISYTRDGEPKLQSSGGKELELGQRVMAAVERLRTVLLPLGLRFGF